MYEVTYVIDCRGTSIWKPVPVGYGKSMLFPTRDLSIVVSFRDPSQIQHLHRKINFNTEDSHMNTELPSPRTTRHSPPQKPPEARKPPLDSLQLIESTPLSIKSQSFWSKQSSKWKQSKTCVQAQNARSLEFQDLWKIVRFFYPAVLLVAPPVVNLIPRMHNGWRKEAEREAT